MKLHQINIFFLAIPCKQAVSSTIQPICDNFTLPLQFTYYQRAGGFYCRGPAKYLQDTYGISFSEAAENTQTTDPNVRFTIKEVTNWDELAARIHQLDDTFDEVKACGPHTPSLFLDGCTDKYWHANANEDTISGIFKTTADAFISDGIVSCLNFSKLRPYDGSEVWKPQGEIGEGSNSIPSSTGTSCAIDPSNANADILNLKDSEVDDDSSGGPCFVFFWSTGCPHCAVARSYIDNDLEDEINMPFRYEAYEVHSGHARELVLGYEQFGWTGEKAVPSVFVGTDKEMTTLVGDKEIIQRLPTPLLQAQNETLECYDFSTLDQSEELVASASAINWGVLTAAALADSINPCAIAVLVILLSGLVASVVPPQHEGEHEPEAENTKEAKAVLSQPIAATNSKPSPSTTSEKSIHGSGDEETAGLTSMNDSVPSLVSVSQAAKLEVDDVSELHQGELARCKEEAEEGTETEHHENNDPVESQQNSQARRAFISGMAFILSIYIAYYLLGFGIFSAVSATGFSDIILLVLGIFIVLLGLWNIKDFFIYDRGYNVEIPRSWRPLLKRILGAIASPVGAFAAGFLVSLFELPCSGGPYLFILGLLSDKNTRTEAAFLLLYYNFIFVLPLIVINCLVYFGVTRVQYVGGWKDKYIRHLHLAVGLILVALGALAITDYFKPLF